MWFAGTSAGTFHHVGRLATIENEVEVKPPPPTKRVRFVDVEKLNSALISAPIPAAAQGRKDEAGGGARSAIGRDDVGAGWQSDIRGRPGIKFWLV
jgi:hypothetical protein